MATEQNLRSISRNADASLAEYTGPPGMPGSSSPNYGKQYRFVKLTGTKQVGLCTAATDVTMGIMQNKPQVAGQAATVGYEGESLVRVGTLPIAAGDLVAPTAAGKAVTDAVNGRWQAQQAATAVDELIAVFRVK